MKNLLFVFIFVCFDLSGADYFYPKSYEQARESFRALSKKALVDNPKGKMGEFKVESQIDLDLTIDFLYLPATSSPEKMVIITSGVHGVEAYTGSALQHLILKEMTGKVDRKKVGFLFIHSVNPYGFKYGRRVSENNVDLNRSFILDRSNFKDTNKAYEKFDSFLNPESSARAGSLFKAWHFVSSGYKVVRYGMKNLKQAVLQGQYHFPKGIFYGGAKAEPQQAIVKKIIVENSLSYKTIFLIDLHTGYGERGTLHFFGIPKYKKAVKEAMNEIFAEQKIDSGSDEDFYSIDGDFTAFVSDLLKNKLVIPMTFEYGTLDSQEISGSIESLRRTKLENQGHHYGYGPLASEEKIKKLFLDMFNPPEESWREKVLKDSRMLIPTFLKRFSRL